MPITDLLRRAVARASRLPAGEQDALAAFVLAELDGGVAWDAVFEPEIESEYDVAERVETDQAARSTSSRDVASGSGP
jgi:hypothetical protein